MSTHQYLVLLSEGGIVQFEYLYDSEALAWQHRAVWMEETEENPDGNEDRDCYIYRIAAPCNVTMQRAQGSDQDSAEYFPVD